MSDSWRCFHCDDVFEDRQSAQDHFGLDCLDLPACIEKVTEGDKAIIESRREWRDRALQQERDNERLEHENSSLRFDLSWGAFKGCRTVQEAEQRYLDMRNRLEAESSALASSGRWVSGFLRWLGEYRAAKRVGGKTPRIGLYLPPLKV